MAPSKKPSGRLLKRPGAATTAAAKIRKPAAAPAKLPEASDDSAEEEEDEESAEDDPIVDPSGPRKARKALQSALLKGQPQKAKKPVTGKAAMERKSVESSLNPLASQLPFHNLADDLERQNFQSAVAALAPDQVLCCRTTTITITPLPTRQQRRH